MSYLILLSLFLIGLLYRTILRYYFFLIGVLLCVIPLLLYWASDRVFLTIADDFARMVVFLLVVALSLSIIPKRRGDDADYSTRMFFWLKMNVNSIIIGYGIWLLLNYFLPTPHAILLTLGIVGAFKKIKADIFIYPMLLFLVGILYERAVAYNIVKADRLGLWLYYTIFVWTVYKIREFYTSKK